MAGAIDFSLLRVPDIGKAFMDGLEKGRRRNALNAFAQDPANTQALNALIPADPEVGFKAAEHRMRMAQYQRNNDTRDAEADFLTSQYRRPTQNALAPQPAPQPVSRGTTMPQSGGAPSAPSSMPPQAGTGIASHPPAQQPDLSFLGQPQSSADHKFMRLIRLDPKRALQIDSSLRDNMVKRLDQEHQFMDFAASALAGVHDEASYQAAVEEADSRMPEANVRAHVPPNYPGPEAIDQLRMRSLSAKEQIGGLLSASNVAADNARADRNTDNLIATRNARVAEDRRYHDMADGTRRRGQDINASTSRRGQDLRGSGPGGRASMPTVSSPEEAAKLAPGTKFRTPDGTIRVRP